MLDTYFRMHIYYVILFITSVRPILVHVSVLVSALTLGLDSSIGISTTLLTNGPTSHMGLGCWRIQKRGVDKTSSSQRYKAMQTGQQYVFNHPRARQLHHLIGKMVAVDKQSTNVEVKTRLLF